MLSTSLTTKPMQAENTIETKNKSAQKGALVFMAGLVGDSIVDGPGLRCTVFTQGCPHACPGCHNPETWPFGAGRAVSAEDIFAEIKRYPLSRAVTLSGGEPFCQAEGLLPLCKILKENGYEIAAYSGYTIEELLNGTPAQKQLLGYLQTLIDGKFVQAEKGLSLRFRGSKNQRVINVPQSIKEGRAVHRCEERWGTV